MDESSPSKLASFRWSTSFLSQTPSHPEVGRKRALVVLNQPFSLPLLHCLWESSDWRVCADGGANRLYDTDGGRLMPDLIKGDLDSIREDVKDYYTSKVKGVQITKDGDQNSTDLQKCVASIVGMEKGDQWEIVLLGGLSGRLDQTVHTLSYLHRLRKTRKKVFAVTDENVGWVLAEGEHLIHVDHEVLGPTCGLLPVGVDSTVLTTNGLEWDLTEQVSSFDGLVSTSNHLVLGEDTVFVRTSRPIWWTVELRSMKLA